MFRDMLKPTLTYFILDDNACLCASHILIKSQLLHSTALLLFIPLDQTYLQTNNTTVTLALQIIKKNSTQMASAQTVI